MLPGSRGRRVGNPGRMRLANRLAVLLLVVAGPALASTASCVRGDLKEETIVESVGGVVASYELGLGFHAGLGFTYNRPWTSHEPKRFEAGTLDPFVEWRKGLGRVGLVAVLPIFGNATLQHTFGLSLDCSARCASERARRA